MEDATGQKADAWATADIAMLFGLMKMIEEAGATVPPGAENDRLDKAYQEIYTLWTNARSRAHFFLTPEAVLEAAAVVAARLYPLKGAKG